MRGKWGKTGENAEKHRNAWKCVGNWGKTRKRVENEEKRGKAWKWVEMRGK